MTNPTEKPKKKKLQRRNSWAGEAAENNSFHANVTPKPLISPHSIKSSSSSASTTSRISSLSKRSTPKLKPTHPHSFIRTYQELCEYYKVLPLATVKNHLPRKILDFSADRLKAKDWRPVYEALIADKELHSISIRSRHPKKVVRPKNAIDIITEGVKYPVLFTHFFINTLIKSLTGCLFQSDSLTCLELVGMPIQSKYLTLLLEGISKSKILQHLSLENCPLGDTGVEELCKTLNNLPSITTLNVSSCGLSSVGIGFIASLIKAQKIQRFMETWQKSLRYQNPNLDAMWGIRRIILNSNPQIGDDGVKLLADILEDDLWVKAIDLQKCGIGKIGAIYLISLLEENCVIAIIDIRNNKNVPASLIKEVMSHLRENNKDRVTEYHWLDLGFTSNTSSTWMPSLSKIQKEGKAKSMPNYDLKSSSLTTIKPTRSGYTICKRSLSQPVKGCYQRKY
ncbi:centrosomal protein of 78 kDa-like [Ischnura elegans]|uniref:centrosomal protein of 78 kDa-like n=1 Tax=Ischnura elegans TaxID=197161 RepID=UPI001ED8737B|nr:centrosomal protein of 78 kDa-like [Ischnura elegans]XP_046396662.1 centrosomal protein of 78 kDa-like [Ischnura elegans]